MIGCGKESDIYLCQAPDGSEMILKLARLGRTSFRSVKANRDYLQNRTQYSWLYLSRLSSLKEFLFMQALYNHGFPTPRPIDSNRHAILMTRIPGLPVCKVKTIKDKPYVYTQAMEMIKSLTKHGLIHCDYNEFNLMLDDNEKLYVIDFPQMVSTSHVNNDMYFKRDVECVKNLFFRKYQYIVEDEEDMEISDFEVIKRLDLEIKASGCNSAGNESVSEEIKDFAVLEQFIQEENEGESEEELEEEEESQNEEEESDENENESDENMIEEPIVEKKVKKNSAHMDIEEMDVSSQKNEDVPDQLQQAILKEEKNHMR